MYRIVQKTALNASVIQMDIQAPLVARKARPGQFVILRVDGQGERIPLTIAGCDEQAGTVRIIFQMVGATTLLLGQKAAGESIPDFVARWARQRSLRASSAYAWLAAAWAVPSPCLSRRRCMPRARTLQASSAFVARSRQYCKRTSLPARTS